MKSKSKTNSILINNPEIDGLIQNAIFVFRVHLFELEKLWYLCEKFFKNYTGNFFKWKKAKDSGNILFFKIF